MKTYRIIGTTLSAVLALIFSLALFLLTAVHGIARAVNKDTLTAIADVFLENEELYDEVTGPVAQTVSTGVTEALTENLPITVTKEQEKMIADTVQEIMNTDEFKDVLSDVTSDLLIDIMDPDSGNVDIAVAEKLSTMLEENPETFDEILDDAVTAYGLNYNEVYAAATLYMLENDLEIPQYGASYSSIAAGIVSASDEELDALLNDYLASMGFSANNLPDIPDTDYAPMNTDAEAEAAIAEMQAFMKKIGTIVEFFKSALYVLIICGTLLLFFGISTLLIWSIKRSLLISGIMTAISAALLFVTGTIKFPTALLMPFFEESFGTAAITAHDILATAWGAATSNITICGIITLAVALLFIGGFILLHILAKKKKATILA